jgi:hypothetical protein
MVRAAVNEKERVHHDVATRNKEWPSSGDGTRTRHVIRT